MKIYKYPDELKYINRFSDTNDILDITIVSTTHRFAIKRSTIRRTALTWASTELLKDLNKFEFEQTIPYYTRLKMAHKHFIRGLTMIKKQRQDIQAEEKPMNYFPDNISIEDLHRSFHDFSFPTNVMMYAIAWLYYKNEEVGPMTEYLQNIDPKISFRDCEDIIYAIKEKGFYS